MRITYAWRSILSTAVILALSGCGDSTSPPAAMKLAFSTQPGSAIAGSPVSPAVTVLVQDANGQTVSGSFPVTIALGNNPQNATLSGVTSTTATNGVATFANLRIDVATTAYTLVASSPNLASATSGQFNVFAGAASKLVFTVQPGTTISNTPVTPPLQVRIADAAGNTVTNANNTVFLQLAAIMGNVSLMGNTVATAVNGVATFPGVVLSGVGNRIVLTAQSAGVSGTTSNEFNVVVGPAKKLGFVVQPVAIGPAATMVPGIVVAVEDEGGNVVTSAGDVISLSIASNPGAGTLGGTTTVSAVNGIATFSTLNIDNKGTAYTLSASTGAFPSVTSNAFDVRDPLAFVAISAGYFRTCGTITGGTAFCWGVNDGAAAFELNTVPVMIGGGFIFSKISAGRTHSCGIAANASYCWGDNSVGELGTGGVTSTSTPANISGNLAFASIEAGYAHSCGVTTSGEGYCWGDNSSGEVGDGTTANTRSLPDRVSGNLTFSTISTGRYFSCGLTTAGAAFCWGDNFSTELGNGTSTPSSVPVAVSGGLAFTAVTAGGFHACGITAAGVAYCWGANDHGALGIISGTNSSTPVAVSGGIKFASISAGNRHTCGVSTTGVGYCWGDNSDGKVGDGSNTQRNTPVVVSGGLTFRSISAGRFHSCGVTTANVGYCWGANASGQVGEPTATTALVPVKVR